MAVSSNDITLGGGKLYIDILENDKPTGRLVYFGLTTGISVSTELDKLEHTNTEGPVQAIDKVVVRKQTATISFSSDDINAKNLARAFLGDVAETLEAKAIEIKSGATVGSVYDTGAYFATITVASNNVSLAEGKDYTYDKKSGLVEIIDSTNISEGTLTITPEGGVNNEMVEALKHGKLEAQLLFVGNTATGTSCKAIFNKVSLMQDGEFALKGEEWLSLGFRGDILKDESKPAGQQFFVIIPMKDKKA